MKYNLLKKIKQKKPPKGANFWDFYTTIGGNKYQIWIIKYECTKNS